MSGVWLAVELVQWTLLLVAAVMLAGALREIALIRLRLGDDPGALIVTDGLQRGEQAPDFSVPVLGEDRNGGLIDVAGRAASIVFLSPSCVSCRELVPHLNEVATTRPDFDFLVVCRGGVDECNLFVNDTGLALRTVVDVDGTIQRKYAVTRTPFAYVLDHHSRVLVSGIANNWVQLDLLLDQEGTPLPSDSAGREGDKHHTHAHFENDERPRETAGNK